MNSPCKRRDGTCRAYFTTKEEAEAFAHDSENHPTYLGDIAALCSRCGFWHLNHLERIGLERRYFCVHCKNEIKRSDNGLLAFEILPNGRTVCIPCSLRAAESSEAVN